MPDALIFLAISIIAFGLYLLRFSWKLICIEEPRHSKRFKNCPKGERIA